MWTMVNYENSSINLLVFGESVWCGAVGWNTLDLTLACQSWLPCYCLSVWHSLCKSNTIVSSGFVLGELSILVARASLYSLDSLYLKHLTDDQKANRLAMYQRLWHNIEQSRTICWRVLPPLMRCVCIITPPQ